jgi:hypothetical protein
MCCAKFRCTVKDQLQACAMLRKLDERSCPGFLSSTSSLFIELLRIFGFLVSAFTTSVTLYTLAEGLAIAGYPVQRFLYADKPGI